MSFDSGDVAVTLAELRRVRDLNRDNFLLIFAQDDSWLPTELRYMIWNLVDNDLKNCIQTIELMN